MTPAATAVSASKCDLARGWPSVRLGDVAQVIAGQSPPGDTYRREPGGLPFFQGKADFGPTHPVARTWCVDPYRVAEPDDILISVRAPVGPTNVANVRCCIGRGLAAIRCGSRLNRTYLLQYLRHVEDELAGQGSGSTFESINRDHLLAIPIPLPPLAEQERIAAKLMRALAAVDMARRTAQARHAVAESLSAAFLREVFGEEPPFTAAPLIPLDPTRPGWRWHLLTDIARLATGHTPSRREPSWWGGEIQWLQLPDIRAVDGRRVYKTAEQTNALGIANSSSVLLPEGTVCMSRTASVGFVTIMGRAMATSQDFVNWVCGPDLDPDFLMHLLIACRKPIRDLGSGATHHSIYFHTVESFAVCVPPVVDQRRIAADVAKRLADAERLVSATEAELAFIDSLPAAFLREAFGEIHEA